MARSDRDIVYVPRPPKRCDLNLLNGAVNQEQRKREAPTPESVAVDGRGLAQLLAFAADYGRHVAFYDLSNEKAGDWHRFFAADPAIAAASHAAIDLDVVARGLRVRLDRLRDADEGRDDFPTAREVLADIAVLIGVLDRIHVDDTHLEQALREIVEGARGDRLAEPLEKVGRLLREGGLDEVLTADLSGPIRNWDITVGELLEDLSALLVDELRERRDEAFGELEESLLSGDHPPQGALWNAFVGLFLEARQTLERFPNRLVDFYYGDVLRENAFPPTPDHVFLTFTKAEGAGLTSVPKGTRFPAGTDSDGRLIDYAATTSLEVTGVTVEEIGVHRIVSAAVGEGVLGCAAAAQVLRATMQLPPDGSGLPESIPMFGSESVATDASPTAPGGLRMEDSDLGLCIAGPVLMLRGGQRTVRVTFAIAAGDSDGLADLVSQRLTLLYSTAGGWVRVQRVDVSPGLLLTPGGSPSSVVASFVLPPDAPPLVPVSETAPPGARPPDRPADAFTAQPAEPALVFKLSLGPDDAEQAGQLLSGVRFAEVSIDVEVAGFTDFALSTPNGTADTRQNFAPFGVPPALNSSFEIAAPELFAKRLNGLSIAIDWAALPVTSTGFAGYYAGYRIDADGFAAPAPLFDNQSFRVRFEVTNPGRWRVDDQSGAFLFRTEPGAETPEPAAPLASRTILTPAVSSHDRDLAYYDPSKSALAVILDAPAYAFGNDLYAANLVAASHAQSAEAGRRATGRSAGGAAGGGLQALAQVNASAPDRSYHRRIRQPVQDALATLAADAVAALKAAIAAGEEPEENKAWRLDDLEQAVGSAAGGTSLLERMTGRADGLEKLRSKLDTLTGWIEQHADKLGGEAEPALQQARARIATARSIAAAHSEGSGLDAATARARLGSALGRQPAAAPDIALLPNPPWVPTASALSLDYSATACSGVAAAVATLGAAAAAAEPELALWHVSPFGLFKPIAALADHSAPLVPDVSGAAALYIQLSAPVPRVSLLFILSLTDQGWRDSAPEVRWEEHVEGAWKRLTPLSDTTSGLKGSGIITLELEVVEGQAKAPRIRAVVDRAVANPPHIDAVVADALTAQWVGPGGASTRGQPLEANSIDKSESKLAGIGSVGQPMRSIGGSPPSVGRDFRMRMAERLRHRDYAITGWDYARLALTLQPSLWQAAVVEASDAGGRTAPGKVWLVAIGGRGTANAADPTAPMVDLATLANLGEILNARAGPFADIVVTNPPYVRQQVVANVDFSDDDVGAAWAKRLEEELILWLSPWPDPKVGARPPDYYELHAVADFIRRRPYVRGIRRCELRIEKTEPRLDWAYLTSAASHRINKGAP